MFEGSTCAEWFTSASYLGWERSFGALQKPPFLEGVTKPDIEMLAANGNKVLLSRHRRRLLCLDLDAGAAKVRKEPRLTDAARGTNGCLDKSAGRSAEIHYEGTSSNQPVLNALAQSLRLFSLERSQASRVSYGTDRNVRLHAPCSFSASAYEAFGVPVCM